MDEDVTADGLPILKKQATTSTTDEGLPILKKKANTIAPVNGSTSLPTGLNPFQSSPANTPYSGITTTPQMQQQLVAQDAQNIKGEQERQQALDKQSSELIKDPSFSLNLKHSSDIYNQRLQAQLNDPNSAYYQSKRDQQAERDASDSKLNITLGDRVAAASNSIYRGSGDMLKGAVRAANAIVQKVVPEERSWDYNHALNNLTGLIDKGVDWAKDYHGLSEEKEAAINRGPINGMINGLAEFAPAIATAERTGGMSFFVNDYEKGYENIDKMSKETGANLSENQKQAFSIVNGAASALLMTHNLHSLMGNLGEKGTDALLNRVTTSAIEDIAKSGEDFSADNVKKAVLSKFDLAENKVKNFGMSAIKGTAMSTGDLSVLESVKIGTEHLVNTATGKKVFDDSNDTERMHSAMQGGAMLGLAASVAKSPLMLAKGSQERNSVIESLYKDPSKENADVIKGLVDQHLSEKGLTPDEIKDTHQTVDELHNVVKTLPKGLAPEKQIKVSDLILQRKTLEDGLKSAKEEQSGLDPAFTQGAGNDDVITQHKIDSINDQIKAIATDTPIKYFRGEDGQPMKQVGDTEPEKIDENRYLIEKPNSLFKAKPNEQTAPNQEVPIEQPTNETGQTAEDVAPVNEASGDSEVIPHPNEVNVLSDEAHKIQNEETDKKIADFQSKFPEHKIDPLEDLPESVVRTFDRVDADVPTDPVAINEASDWLYNKYKQLTAMKESDTRRLTITQIEAMQEQLGEDITILENHKQKYHGEESVTTEPAKSAEVKSTEQDPTIADENGGSGTATKPSQEKIKEGNTDATKIESTGKMDVGEPSGDSGTLGEGNTGKKESTGESQPENGSSENAQAKAEEVKPTTAAKNATTDEIAAELGIDLNYDKGGARTKEVVESEADKELKDGYDVHELIDKITNDKHKATDTETVILAKHIAAKEIRIKEIDSDIEANGATMPKAKFDALLNEKTQSQNEFQDGAYALKKTGTETARALGARRFNVNNDYSLADMITRKREAVGDKLTPKQLDDVTKRFNELEKANKDYEARIAKLESDNARLEAEKAMKRVKDAADKTKKPSLTKEQVKEQLAKERKQIADDFSKKLKDMRQSGALNDVFKASAEFLTAAAPYVAKMVHNLAKEGVLELKDVIERIKDELDLKDLSDRDMTDLISGKYNEKAPTKSELQEQVADLKQQAKLIGHIEDAENGLKGLKNGSNGQKKQSAKVEELRQRLAELTKEPAKDPEEQRLHQSKVAVNKTIRELTDKINAGDFTRDKPTPVKPDAELLTLRRERDKLREDFDLGVARDKLAQRTKLEKAKHIALDIASLPRALKATLDFSAVLRQGLILGISHPTKAADAFIKMFGQTFSEKKYHDWLSDIKHHPQYDLMKESGLYISEKHNPDVLAREEEFTSNLAEKIPIIGKSIKYKGKTVIPGIDAIGGAERAYSSYLNVLRTGVFLDGADKLQKQGYTFENNPEQFKSLAKVINIFSGRGDIPEFLGGKQPTILSSLFFSPRFWASRIQSLYLYGDTRLTKQARITAAKDMATALGVVGSLIGMAGLAGFKIQLNPTSPNFLRIQDKDTKYDVLAGLGSNITFLAQEIMGQKMNAKGGIQKMNTGKFNGITRASNMMNFLRGKLSPGVSIPYNLLSGKDYIGNKYDLSNVPGEFVPLPFTDIQDAYKLGGLENALKVFAPAIFGIGVSTYNPNQKPKK